VATKLLKKTLEAIERGFKTRGECGLGCTHVKKLNNSKNYESY
jgi:hypothetical protein